MLEKWWMEFTMDIMKTDHWWTQNISNEYPSSIKVKIKYNQCFINVLMFLIVIII